MHHKNIIVKKLKLFQAVIFISIIGIQAYAKESVVFAIDIIRHGDRTPITEIPNDPYKWPEGLGELTATGMQQEFNLGKKLRDIYVKQYKLLPSTYNSNNLYVRSTDFNRTLVSAQAVLLGLYPLGTGPLVTSKNLPALPMRYQPIPVHTVPQSQDSMLLAVKTHPEFESLITKYVTSSEQWRKKSAQYQIRLQYWEKITGFSIKNLSQVVSLGDNLYIRMLHGIPMPQGISDKDRDDIIHLTNWVVSTKFMPHEVGAYTSKDLRAAIAEYLNTATTSKSELKYVLLSAHETTLMPLMSALGQPLDKIAPYSSDLRILLIKNDSDKSYYVHLKFNENDITLKNCGKNCSLADFLQYLN